MCVEGLCNIFFCAINNRFVWVLPLLLPLPVTSWSDSSVLLLVPEEDEPGSQCEGLEPQILGPWECLPGKSWGSGQ